MHLDRFCVIQFLCIQCSACVDVGVGVTVYSIESVKTEQTVATISLTFEKQSLYPEENIRSWHSHSSHECANAHTGQDTKVVPKLGVSVGVGVGVGQSVENPRHQGCTCIRRWCWYGIQHRECKNRAIVATRSITFGSSQLWVWVWVWVCERYSIYIPASVYVA